MRVQEIWKFIFTHEYHIPLGQCPQGIWYSWVNKIVTLACKWCVPSASDVFLSKNDNSGGKTCEASEGVEYHITCRRALQFVVDVVFKCLRQRSNGQQYFTCMCFLGFIRYNKTFIACGFRKYENLYSPTSIIRGFRGGGIWFLFRVIWFCPVWSRVLIFTHCPIKLIYLW
jgi:hypothetical protein